MINYLSQRKFQLAITILTAVLVSVPLVARGAFDGFPKIANRRQSSERKLELKEKSLPKGVIEILGMKNLQSENFPEGFELEVKNISDKPIYCVHFIGILEEARQVYGTRVLFDLVYGATRLRNTKALAEEGDIPLLPGESVVLKPWALHVKGILMRAEKDPAFATLGRSRVVLMMNHINFGDGTGYRAGGFYPASRASLEGFYDPEPCPGDCVRATGEIVTEGCGEGCPWEN